MNGLQAQFHCQIGAAGEFFQIVQYRLWQTVSPGSHRKSHHAGQSQRRLKSFSQHIYRSIGVGSGLKIGDVAGTGPLLVENRFHLGKLRLDGAGRIAAEITALQPRAVSAAAHAAGPIPVRAGESGIEGDFAHLFAVAMAKIVIPGVVALVVVRIQKTLQYQPSHSPIRLISQAGIYGKRRK